LTVRCSEDNEVKFEQRGWAQYAGICGSATGPGAKFFGALRNAICEITNTAKKAIKFTRFLGNGAQISACDDKSTKFDAQEIAQPQKLI
jgi:hypothetical protein